jgi:hypothetical protein
MHSHSSLFTPGQGVMATFNTPDIVELHAVGDKERRLGHSFNMVELELPCQYRLAKSAPSVCRQYKK